MKSFKTALFWMSLFLGNYLQAQVNDSTEVETEEKVSPAIQEDSVQAIDWKAIKQRLVYGGSLGLSFYPPFTLYQVSPQLGYRIKENTIAGVGLQLFGVSSQYSSYVQYGPDIFLRQHLLNIFFVQTQFEYINFENYILPGKRIWNPGLLLGFGYGTYGYSLGLFTDIIQTRNSEFIYPGNIYFGPRTGSGRYPNGVPFFLRGQIFF